MANKKYSVLAVLRVLEDYSDEEHSLYIKEIQGLIESEYGIVVGEKTIRTDIRALLDFGFDIRFVGSYRRVVAHKDGTVIDSDINTGCYLVGELTDEEIEVLYSSLAGNRFVFDRTYKSLVAKLERLSSTYAFSLNSKSVIRTMNDVSFFDSLNSNLKIVKEAIVKRRVITYMYAPVIPLDSFKNKTRSVSPCKVFVENGIFYLAGCDNNVSYEERLVFIRIDRMRGISFAEHQRYDLSSITGKGLISGDFAKKKFKLDRGEDIKVVFRCPLTLATETADYFGRKKLGLRIRRSETDNETFFITAPEDAILRFAQMYAPEVEIIEPIELRDKLKANLNRAIELNK